MSLKPLVPAVAGWTDGLDRGRVSVAGGEDDYAFPVVSVTCGTEGNLVFGEIPVELFSQPC